MWAALLGLILVCSSMTLGAFGGGTAAPSWPASSHAARKNAARSKNRFKYPPPATSTRSTPGMFFSEFAISCASPRGGFFRRLASSKHSGEATSPMDSFGGRSVTTGTSVLQRSWMWWRSALRIRSSTALYTWLLGLSESRDYREACESRQNRRFGKIAIWAG